MLRQALTAPASETAPSTGPTAAPPGAAPRRRWLAALAVVAIGIAVSAALWTPVEHRWIVSGGAYIGAGLYAWNRRPESRVGVLLVLIGVGIWSALAQATRVPLVWTLGSALETLWVPPLVYLSLSFPHGRLTSAPQRFVMWATFTVLLVGVVAGSTVYDPRDFGCDNCQAGLNLLLVRSNPTYVTQWGSLVQQVLLLIVLLGFLLVAVRRGTVASRARLLGVLAGTALPVVAVVALLPAESLRLFQRLPVLALVFLPLVGMIVARWWRASPPAQRLLSPMLLPTSAFLLAVSAQQLAAVALNYQSVFTPTPYLFKVLTDVALVASVSLPLAFLLALARARHRRAVVSDLVLELGDLPPAGELEQVLVRTLRDPSLRVGRWDPTAGTYLDADGHVLELPQEGPGGAVTLLERNGSPLAAIRHDPALREEGGLLGSVAAATLLVVENEKLQAEVLAQLADVRASRARIVAAADVERRRLERDLHDGAQQQIVSVCLDLKLAAAAADPVTEQGLKQVLEQAAVGLQEALAELRELARGIHPSVLTDEGLGPALQSLAERARVPTQVRYAVEGPLQPAVETAAYFVASEALTNVVKHARASHATVTVTRADGRLRIDVEDDGVGGVDVDGGTGLRGLLDRVSAIDGRLHVEAPAGRGTRVRAELPCG